MEYKPKRIDKPEKIPTALLDDGKYVFVISSLRFLTGISNIVIFTQGGHKENRDLGTTEGKFGQHREFSKN